MWYCYLLTCGSKTYIGATVDPDRRLLQHNGFLSGGAKATRGNTWERKCLVGPFDNNHDALSFEWHWKHNSKKYKGNPLERRMKALESMVVDNLSVEIS